MIYNWDVKKGEILNGANFEIDLSLAPFGEIRVESFWEHAHVEE